MAQHTSEQPRENIEYENNTDIGTREVQDQVVATEEILDPTKTSSVMNTNINAINNEYEHKYHSEIMRLLNAHPIPESADSGGSSYKRSFPGVPGTKFLVHKVLPMLFI